MGPLADAAGVLSNFSLWSSGFLYISFGGYSSMVSDLQVTTLPKGLQDVRNQWEVDLDEMCGASCGD